MEIITSSGRVVRMRCSLAIDLRNRRNRRSVLAVLVARSRRNRLVCREDRLSIGRIDGIDVYRLFICLPSASRIDVRSMARPRSRLFRTADARGVNDISINPPAALLVAVHRVH